MVVSRVKLDAFCSAFAASTPSAEVRIVPPTQNPSVLARSAPVTSSATSIAFITPFSR